jgi:putative tryptophan/tyrosine transport system substrate-binding protein
VAAVSPLAWPLAVRAQQGLRRVGMLMDFPENDPVSQARLAVFREGLTKLGWIEGRNLRIEARFFGNDPDRMRRYAAELVSLAPEVIVVVSAAATKELQAQTRTIPIVFTFVGDPVASGIVESIARPEGNATGFTNLVVTIGGKWVELLKQAVPAVNRIAIVFNPEFPVTNTFFRSIDAAAAVLALEATRTPVRNAAEIERAINRFATATNGGLILVPPPFNVSERGLIYRLAIQHRLPVFDGYSVNAVAGALISFAPDSFDPIRGAVTYVDRILRGAKPGDLPVQFPTRFKLTVNLKTAKAIGLNIPESFLLRADEVIE